MVHWCLVHWCCGTLVFGTLVLRYIGVEASELGVCSVVNPLRRRNDSGR